MISNNLKLLRSLSQKKYRDKFGLFMVEGHRFVSEIPEGLEIIQYAYTNSFSSKNVDFEFRANARQVLLSDNDFSYIADTVSPQGIIAVCRKMNNSFEYTLENIGDGLVLILDGINDPGNLGTIIRTSDASGVKAVLLTKNSVDFYNPKVLRSTMGSIFNVPVFQNVIAEEIVAELKKRKFIICGASARGEKIYYNKAFEAKTALIIGSEAHGISYEIESLCDQLISIPIEGRIESLNAGVAAAILMYEYLRQRKMERE